MHKRIDYVVTDSHKLFSIIHNETWRYDTFNHLVLVSIILNAKILLETAFYTHNLFQPFTFTGNILLYTNGLQ